jgi:transcriptional regulator with XRE-family HTH domain
VIAESLRRERQRAGISLSDLARRAGIGKSTLSQLESGTGNPNLETLWALGGALGIPVSRLLSPPAARVTVLRAGEGPTIEALQSRYRATLIATFPAGGRRDLYRITAEPGEPRESGPHMAGLSERVVLCTGRALVGPTVGPVELRPGDYISYPGDEWHVFRALAPGTSAVLVQESG